MDMDQSDALVLITGGHGFIGGHLARKLCELGYKIRVTDISPHSYFPTTPAGIQTVVGDLLDPTFCRRVVSGVQIVIHLAATMGGMGTIHTENDSIIYKENHSMTMNVVSASMDVGVQKFLYASSACVYPELLQSTGDRDVSLREEHTSSYPPSPQGLYGLEKLSSEHLLHCLAGNMKTYVARFHNVFGPHGSWIGGREKVPAALLRKVIAGQLLGQSPIPLEIWGDGFQRRSFCYVDDAIDGIIRLLQSDWHEPINIGSDRAVSIQDLAAIALQSSGVAPQKASLRYLPSRPVGVGSRNSNNELVQEKLGWSPQVRLETGMTRTAEWIKGEIDTLVAGLNDEERDSTLRYLQTSSIVHLKPPNHVIFAILLPITSRTSPSDHNAKPEDCLNNLTRFARSLLETTRGDTREPHARFCVRVYLAIDESDEFLWQGSVNRAETVLRREGITDVVSTMCNFPRGHVCSLWRATARRAWKDGCDYFVLMGDDVKLLDNGWMSAIDSTFRDFSRDNNVPRGFGCVAFTDISFPGMPTFPVVHRTHMDVFEGQVVPDVFINQDGDPFLFQLYRRFGCSAMVPLRLSNLIGGSVDARYEKQHALDWTFSTLGEATTVIESYLGSCSFDSRKLTIDIVIPCYRVNMKYLDQFLALRFTPRCSVMFIIIVDDPLSPNITELKEKYGRRPDVRIRVNQVNSGASASRNRGLRESSAEWVHFLDDDVEPKSDLLVELEKVIRAHPDAAGFVGNAQFPLADTVYTTAIHLAGVTYFWDIATKIKRDVPWGVTANLTARRNVKDGVVYDLTFPKTGGGEDIDYCRKKRRYSIDRGGQGFVAAPAVTVTHPYWNGGRRSYWRFYMWSKGDGALIKLYPSLVYLDDAPNSAELFLISFLWTAGSGAASHFVNTPRSVIIFGPCMAVAVFCANIFHDVYRHCYREADRTLAIKSDLVGYRWVLAVVESSFIRMFSEIGRVVGLLERRDLTLLGHRFDWFAGVLGEAPQREERKNSRQRITKTSVQSNTPETSDIEEGKVQKQRPSLRRSTRSSATTSKNKRPLESDNDENTKLEKAAEPPRKRRKAVFVDVPATKYSSDNLKVNKGKAPVKQRPTPEEDEIVPDSQEEGLEYDEQASIDESEGSGSEFEASDEDEFVEGSQEEDNINADIKLRAYAEALAEEGLDAEELIMDFAIQESLESSRNPHSRGQASSAAGSSSSKKPVRNAAAALRAAAAERRLQRSQNKDSDVSEEYAFDEDSDSGSSDDSQTRKKGKGKPKGKTATVIVKAKAKHMSLADLKKQRQEQRQRASERRREEAALRKKLGRKLTQAEKNALALRKHHPELRDVWGDVERAIPIVVPVRAEQPARLKATLLPFQQESLSWMKQQEKGIWKGGMLADEMGMGKTIQMIALLLSDHGAKPNLVIAPTVAVMQWRNEIEAHAEGMDVLVWHGQSRETDIKSLKKHDVVLTTYAVVESCFRKQQSGFKRKGMIVKEKSPVHQIVWNRIILDEAHNIKERSTNTAKAAFELQSSFKWCLSGTPLQNRVGELYSLIRFLGGDPFSFYFCKQCDCKSLHWRFKDKRTCDDCGHSPMQHTCFWNNEILTPIQKNGMVGPGVEAFKKLRILLDRMMLRRTKIQRADDLGLPPRIVVVRRDYFSPEEKELYLSLFSDAKRQFNTFVDSGTVLNTDVGEATVCRLCNDIAEDAIQAKCRHIFDRECIKQYLNTALEQTPDCPVCHIPLTIDLEAPALDLEENTKTRQGILGRLDLDKWRSSSKIEALIEELSNLRRQDATTKSIVFSQFVNFLDLIAYRLQKAGFSVSRFPDLEKANRLIFTHFTLLGMSFGGYYESSGS
ncbi:hypothetical protein PHLCEN_2v2223 [Hermanssonia centrifuga]|uniref:RING-type domain-containing protein n=1 Tax=Hermanssonia centrifuga TaxID=98765 RepID=A0A2R6RPN0_9APHY|nr:hypothetical protein PHLCEN_2v2223 [Hermanssonia centrifuga]